MRRSGTRVITSTTGATTTEDRGISGASAIGQPDLPYTPAGYYDLIMRPNTQDQARKRIRRIAGQVAGIERMIDEDRYCVDVLLQVAAVRAALDGLGKLLLKSHVETCVADAIGSGRPRDRKEKIAELLEVFSKFAHIGGR